MLQHTSSVTQIREERRRPWPVAQGADPVAARQWYAAKLWLESQPDTRGCFVTSVHDHGFWYFGPIFAPQHVSWERLRN